MTYPWLQPLFSHLVSRLHNKSLHHGILLCGPAGIGKYDFSFALSKAILCKQPTADGACGQCHSCQLFEASTHSDFAELISDKQLGVDKIRQGIGRLNSTAHIGVNKVLVIPNAHTMTEAAANALLKTLEEPTDNTFILLITNQPGALLPTILSRCEKQNIPLPQTSDSINWLREQGIHEVTPAQLKAYDYAPLRVKDALSGDVGITYTDFQQEITALLGGQKSARQLADKWQSDAVLVTGWIQREAHESFINSLSEADYQRFSACSQAQKSLQHAGVNKTLILSGVLESFCSNS